MAALHYTWEGKKNSTSILRSGEQGDKKKGITNLEYGISAAWDMLGVLEPRSVDYCRVGRNAEPLLPRLMECQDEQTQQCSPPGELEANEVAHPGQRKIGAVKKDALEDFRRKGVERAPVARCSSGHDRGQRLLSPQSLDRRFAQRLRSVRYGRLALAPYVDSGELHDER